MKKKKKLTKLQQLKQDIINLNYNLYEDAHKCRTVKQAQMNFDFYNWVLNNVPDTTLTEKDKEFMAKNKDDA